MNRFMFQQDWERVNTSRKSTIRLSRRERQIFEIVASLGEASVADVIRQLPDAPSYSAVRATLSLLTKRGWLKHRADGKRYLYRPATSVNKTGRIELKRMLTTFFAGSATDAIATLLDVSSRQLTPEQYDEMMEMIRKAKQENSEDA
ncbi:MAG: BlaI/MecI/CopY family transcriptional regulator [Planctomycetota bacterium]